MSQNAPISEARAIAVEQPLAAVRLQHNAQLYQWWRLPSGQVVELRRIEGAQSPEVTVRNVNADGEMAAGEYKLTLRFLVTRCKLERRGK